MIYGYSERGIFNSIIYYLDYKNPDLIGCFLEELGIQGFSERNRFDFTFLNEHSFSKFGSNDLTIIIEEKNTKNKYVIFVEGKIGSFSLEKAFKKIENIFEDRGKLINQIKKEYYTSNLFIQLYFKYLLPKIEYKETKKDLGIAVDERFKGFFRKNGDNRKIGTNETVLRGHDLIKKAEKYFYVAIIPKQEKNQNKKIGAELLQNYFTKLGLLKNENIKCAFWQDIEKFFKDKGVDEVINNFDFNRNQIYKVEK